MLNRAELATFLRTRRDRLTPRDVGLPSTDRRRTPGLRRQEVAQLAGMSIDYYIRLEQARGPRPSRQILAALARALMLTRDEREYLFRIADESPPQVASPSREVTPGIRHLLDSLTETPAYVVDAKYDILAWNPLATHFIGNLEDFPDHDRNMIRWMFSRPPAETHWSDPDAQRFARGTVADLRASYASYPGDPGIEGLVTELLGVSPHFADMWAEHEVEIRRPLLKRVNHPQTGPLEFECQVLHIPETGQRLIVYCAAPASPTQQAFRRLAADLELARPLRRPHLPRPCRQHRHSRSRALPNAVPPRSRRTHQRPEQPRIIPLLRMPLHPDDKAPRPTPGRLNRLNEAILRPRRRHKPSPQPVHRLVMMRRHLKPRLRTAQDPGNRPRVRHPHPVPPEPRSQPRMPLMPHHIRHMLMQRPPEHHIQHLHPAADRQ
jgi:transcriptional regulator with XRE-family HTH domain